MLGSPINLYTHRHAVSLWALRPKLTLSPFFNSEEAETLGGILACHTALK